MTCVQLEVKNMIIDQFDLTSFYVIDLIWPVTTSLPLTMLSALSVVSSRDAAKHPSSVDPPSHIPANAAMLLVWQR